VFVEVVKSLLASHPEGQSPLKVRPYIILISDIHSAPCVGPFC